MVIYGQYTIIYGHIWAYKQPSHGMGGHTSTPMTMPMGMAMNIATWPWPMAMAVAMLSWCVFPLLRSGGGSSAKWKDAKSLKALSIPRGREDPQGWREILPNSGKNNLYRSCFLFTCFEHPVLLSLAPFVALSPRWKPNQCKIATEIEAVTRVQRGSTKHRFLERFESIF